MSENLLAQVAENVGFFIEYWGFKSIHGRVWTLVYLSKEPISTPEIVAKLGVSKGLISMAVNELLEYGLILPAKKVSHGAQTYVHADDVATVVRKILEQRELKSLADADSQLQELRKLSEFDLEKMNVCTEKLGKLEELTSGHMKLLGKLTKKDLVTIDQWLKYVKRMGMFLR